MFAHSRRQLLVVDSPRWMLSFYKMDGSVDFSVWDMTLFSFDYTVNILQWTSLRNYLFIQLTTINLHRGVAAKKIEVFKIDTNIQLGLCSSSFNQRLIFFLNYKYSVYGYNVSAMSYCIQHYIVSFTDI